jgi:Zn ribbon nucleic-acid-binding protein
VQESYSKSLYLCAALEQVLSSERGKELKPYYTQNNKFYFTWFLRGVYYPESNIMEEIMNCPYCNHQDHLEIDLHADGFSSNLLECTECGAVLVNSGGKLETVHGPDKIFKSAMVNVTGC